MCEKYLTLPYYHTDAQGSTTELSDEAGNRTSRYRYTAFGEMRIKQDGGSDNQLLYAGREYDGESGLYYNRFRMYAPGLGRFTGKDSMPGDEMDPMSMHRYLYALNNPNRYTDPMGLESWEDNNYHDDQTKVDGYYNPWLVDNNGFNTSGQGQFSPSISPLVNTLPSELAVGTGVTSQINTTPRDYTLPDSFVHPPLKTTPSLAPMSTPTWQALDDSMQRNQNEASKLSQKDRLLLNQIENHRARCDRITIDALAKWFSGPDKDKKSDPLPETMQGLLYISKLLGHGEPGNDSPEKKSQDATDPRIQSDHFIKKQWDKLSSRKSHGERLIPVSILKIPNYHIENSPQVKTGKKMTAGLLMLFFEAVGTYSEIYWHATITPLLQKLGAQKYPHLVDAPAGQFEKLRHFISDRQQSLFFWHQGAQVAIFDKQDIRTDDYSGSGSKFVKIRNTQEDSLYGYFQEDATGQLPRYAYREAQYRIQCVRTNANFFLERYIQSYVSNYEARFQQWYTFNRISQAMLPPSLQPFIIPSRKERQERAWHLSLGYVPSDDQIRSYPWDE